jgi:transcriptional regulator with XRE-family HTH domain
VAKKASRRVERSENPATDDFVAWFARAAQADPALELAVRDAKCRSDLLLAMVRCRREIGLSQVDVAAAMETSQSAVSELEGGATDPRLSTLQRYARAVQAELHVSLHSSVLGQYKNWLASPPRVQPAQRVLLPASVERPASTYRAKVTDALEEFSPVAAAN